MKSIGFMIKHPHFITHAKALVNSIRMFGGILANYAIFILVPPEFDTNINIPSANIMEFSLSKELTQYPFVDKIAAAQKLEQHLQGDGFIWMDADSLVLQSPENLILNSDKKIGFKPVDKKNIGISFNQELDDFWHEIYNYFELTPSFIKYRTSVSEEKIYPYINAGLITIPNPEQVFTKTMQAIVDLAQKESIKGKIQSSVPHRIFFHQAVLTVAILKTFTPQERVHLPNNINYPLHFHNELNHDLDSIQTLRYDTFFNDSPTIPSLIQSKLDVPPEQLKMIWAYQ